jgi:amino acid transporter
MLLRLLVGAPLPTQQLEQERLNNVRALAAFSPDALSSIAYANQEIYLGLVVAGSVGLSLSLPIGLAITGLLVIVAVSYLQTIQSYPSGGGSYVVARENLGTLPGLIAAAALLVDYLLTAAVSLTAGVAAIASAAPELWPYRVPLALGLLLAITLANLRGLRESGTLMAVPVYLFLFTYLPMLAYGLIRTLTGSLEPAAIPVPPATAPLTALIVLHSFSAGCTALTGIEAISNGVPSFRSPAIANARRVMLVMAALMAVLFIGSIALTQVLNVIAAPQETILSALSRRLLGSGPPYVLIQISTTLILSVAANTSFAGFPRLAAVLSQDGFLPRQLTGLGDRLVFANGILLLSLATGALIVVFNGDTHALVPLFAVGVFLAYSLSQIGMVIHWLNGRGNGWRSKALLNGVGGLITTLTLLVVGLTKFVDGAWLSLLLIAILVAAFLKIRSYYREVAQQLSKQGLPSSLTPSPRPRVVVPIAGLHRGTISALNFARSISDDVTAVYVELEPGSGQGIQDQWEKWCPDIGLAIVPSPYRSIVGPFLDFLDRTDQERHDGQLATVVLPDFIPASWWQGLLHNHTAWLIKVALLYRRRHRGFQPVIIDVPYHLRH